MRSGARTFLSAGAALVAAMPGPVLAQTGAGVRPGAQPDVISQSISVPVYPGHLLAATVMLPALAETPIPAVLLLTMGDPHAAAPPASDAVATALLAHGVAVVRLDLPPAPMGQPRGAEPLAQPADDAYAVLQFVREREDIDGDRLAIVGIGTAAEAAVRAAALDAAVRALVLLGARPISRDTMDLPTSLPVMALPIEMRAAPVRPEPTTTPAADAAAFLTRHLE